MNIQKLLSKYKFEILVALGLMGAYFFLRLYNIMSLPIFTDEAIYVRWSQIARQDASWRFISLTDGKQPMLVWFAMNLMRVIEDPLLASRLTSVAAGFFTMIGIFFLGTEIFKNRFIGFISSALYVLFPFALVYDRMALYDSMVGTFAVWSLYLQVFLVRRLRLDASLILGMVMGGAVLTKTSGFFNVYLIPLTLLIFDFDRKTLGSRLLKWGGLFGLSALLAYGCYSVLRLSPFFYIISEKNALFVYPISEWINHPLEYALSNLSGLWNWFITYMTWPVFLLVLSSFFINLKFTRDKILLFLWFLIPFTGLVLFGKTLYPRFIFFMTLPLLPLAAFSIHEIYSRLRNKWLSVLTTGALLVLFLRADFFILSDFKNAPIADPDLSQYINNWPAGGGVKEAISYLEKEAEKGPIYIVSPGTFGSLPTYSVEIYLNKNKNVLKEGVYPVPSQIPQSILERAKTMPVYVLVSSQKEFEDNIKLWPVEQILEYKKGTGDVFTRLYIVKPS